MTTPVIMFAYNRPDNFRRVLNSVIDGHKGKIIFIIDGPKNDRVKENTDECIRIAESARHQDKEIIIHEKNRGLPGISADLDMISDRYERFMVIEDDCLPMPGFFDFVQNALDFYDTYKEVFAIGGYQLLPKKYFRNYNYSVMSTNRFMCWGWATWSSKWKELRNDRINYASLFDNLDAVPDTAGVDLKDGAIAVKEGRIKTWDIQVSLAMLHHKKVMILPVDGLIKNIGLSQGTHGAGDYHPNHNLNIYDKGINNIVYKSDVKIDKFQRTLNNYIKNIYKGNSFSFRLKKFLNSINPVNTSN